MTQTPEPSFSVQYVSPLDANDIVDLVCTSSDIAKTQAGCLGDYATAEHKVEVICEITLGAVSGPGCETRVVGGLGEAQDPRYRDYLNPPGAGGPNPNYLQD